MLAQLCLEHSRTTSSRHTASSDSFHPPPEPPPPPRAPRGPAAPGAAPCAGCPAAFKPGPACRAAAGGPASAGRAASASSRRSAGPGQRLRTRPHGAILDPPPPARPPRRTHAVCKAARRLTSPRRATPLSGGEVGVASRGHAPPAPPLIHAPSRPPLRGRAPFWARAPLGPNFLQPSSQPQASPQHHPLSQGPTTISTIFTAPVMEWFGLEGTAELDTHAPSCHSHELLLGHPHLHRAGAAGSKRRELCLGRHTLLWHTNPCCLQGGDVAFYS